MRYVVERFDEVVSTNEGVKRALEQGAAEGLVHRARIQTGGYGRQGRSWSSPEGGLYQSLLLSPNVPLAKLPTLGLVVALSIREALVSQIGCDSKTIQLKWPNDVVCATGKLAGISQEAHAGGVCVGMGANVVRPTVERPVGGKYVPAYACDIAPGCATLTPDMVGDAILDALAPRYRTWLDEGFGPFADEFWSCSSMKGRSLSVEFADGLVLSVEARGIDGEGRLVVEGDDGIRRLSTGEVHVL